jgi:predicted esterase
MPVLLGCSERDPHIPIARVHETDAVMRALGAEVTTRIYPGSDHGINEDELGIARQILHGWSKRRMSFNLGPCDLTGMRK